MRKIKGLRVRKASAARARRAMFELVHPAYSTVHSSFRYDEICGEAWGCCDALDNYADLNNPPAIQRAFKEFVTPTARDPQAMLFWWYAPRTYLCLVARPRRTIDKAYTARIIALESFALYCEEHGV